MSCPPACSCLLRPGWDPRHLRCPSTPSLPSPLQNTNRQPALTPPARDRADNLSPRALPGRPSASGQPLSSPLKSFHLTEGLPLEKPRPRVNGLSRSLHEHRSHFWCRLCSSFYPLSATPGPMALGQRRLPRLLAPPPSLPLLTQPLREDGQQMGLGPGAWNAVWRLVLRPRLGSGDISAVAREQGEAEGSGGPGSHPDPHCLLPGRSLV